MEKGELITIEGFCFTAEVSFDAKEMKKDFFAWLNMFEIGSPLTSIKQSGLMFAKFLVFRGVLSEIDVYDEYFSKHHRSPDCLHTDYIKWGKVTYRRRVIIQPYEVFFLVNHSAQVIHLKAPGHTIDMGEAKKQFSNWLDGFDLGYNLRTQIFKCIHVYAKWLCLNKNAEYVDLKGFCNNDVHNPEDVAVGHYTLNFRGKVYSCFKTPEAEVGVNC